MSKTVNTRIKLKYDTLANWTSNNPKLLAGEIALVSVPAEQTADNDTTPVMYKVGDGTNSFTDLQWGSAKAADVYSWAKQSKPKVSLSGTSGNVVTGISSDGNGITYTMSTIDTTDTKNTAGATEDTIDNLFFIGVKEQTANPQTFSNSLLSMKGGFLYAPHIVSKSSDYTIGTSTSRWSTVYASTVDATILKGTYLKAGNSSNAQNLIIPDGTSGVANTLALTSDIPTVNDGTLTIQANGTQKGTFSANQSGNATVNITAADLGLSSAMKFGGVSLQTLSEGGTQNAGATSGNYTTSTQPSNGTVYLDKAGHLEYVWVSGTSSALGHWELLGQDGSYALSSVTVTGIGALGGGGDLTASRTITHNTGNAASKSSGFYKFSTDAYSHVGSVTAVASSDIAGAGGVTELGFLSNASKTIVVKPSTSGEVGLNIGSSNLAVSHSQTSDNLITYSINANTASSTTLGVIKTGYTTSASNKNYKVDVDSSGNAYVNVPWTDTNTNTWRTIRVDDQDVLSSATSSGALNFANGTYVQFSYDSGIKANLSNAVLTTDDQVIIDCGSSSVNVF